MTEENEKKFKIPIGLIILVFAFAALLILYSETMAENVTISGLTQYSEEEFLERAGMDGVFKNTYLFRLREANKAHDSIPYIDVYYVEIKDKNTVSFQVYETGPIGCVKVMGNFFAFDKDGIVLGSSSVQPENIPIVTGLEFDEIIVFNKLKVPKKNVFDVVLEIIQMLRKYDISVSKIEFGDTQEVTLYSENLEILLGARDKYDSQITALSGVIEEASKIGGVIDLRNYNDEKREIILKHIDN